MKLMPIKQAQAKLFNAMSDKTLKAITLYTFKKDRLILTTGSKDKRLIKEAFKREFPRSTRAYVAEIH